MALPTFVIPGAGKSGTSYIAEMLDQHPDIYMGISKEPAFFSTHEERGTYNRGIQYYYRNYIGYSGQREIGDASTVYMYDPMSPGLLKKHLGEIKLIFMLRNPIERVYSNYWQYIKTGKLLPDFNKFVSSDSDKLREMIYVSKYDIHLTRYFKVFEKNRIIIKSFDELKEDARELLNDITDFIAVERFPIETDLTARVNESATSRFYFISRMLYHKKFTRSAKEIIPPMFLNSAKCFSKFIRKFIQKPIVYPPMDGSSRSILLEHLGPTIDRLEVIWGRDLSNWKK